MKWVYLAAAFVVIHLMLLLAQHTHTYHEERYVPPVSGVDI